MNIRELIEQLEAKADHFGDDKEVYFACDYGDRCHTQQLIKIDDVLDPVRPVETAYSASGLALPRNYDVYDESDDEGNENAEEVIVIR